MEVKLGRANGYANSISTEAGLGTTGWVAIVSKGKEVGEVEYSFLKGDKSRLSKAGKGDVVYEDPKDGYYAAESVVRSYQFSKFYFRINGEDVYMYDSQEELASKLWEISLGEYRELMQQRESRVRRSRS